MEERELLEGTKRAEEIEETAKTVEEPGQGTEKEPDEELQKMEEVKSGEEPGQGTECEPTENLQRNLKVELDAERGTEAEENTTEFAPKTETSEVNKGQAIDEEGKVVESKETEAIKTEKGGVEGETPENSQKAEKIKAEEIKEEKIAAESPQPSAETAPGPTPLQFEPQFGQQRKQTWSYNLVPNVVPRQTEGRDARRRRRRKWKKAVFGRKLAVVICLGLLFGALAGTGFYVTNRILDSVHPTAKVHIAVTGENNRTEEKNRTAEENLPSAGNENQASAQEEETQREEAGKGQEAGTSESGIRMADTEKITVVTSDVTQVVEEVMPAMVSIVNNYTASGTNIFGQTYSQAAAASGSGIIIGESETELLIATNYHVVSDASRLEVTFLDGTTSQAQIKGTDSRMDLAVVAIPLEELTDATKEAIAMAKLGDSDSLKLGEPVIAIGNALGYGQSVTNGIVSALNRELTTEDGETGTYIQTNAAINPGNSGGALLNIKGEVIGINSNKIGGTAVEGMGYAIPISAAEPIIEELMQKETRTRFEDGKQGFIGISMQNISEEFSQTYRIPQGIYVVEIVEGSPAEEAGILAGDVIVSFEGETITEAAQLQSELRYYGPGSEITLTLMRPVNGTYQSMDVTLVLGKR